MTKTRYWLLLSALLVAGLAMFGWSFRYPWYTVSEKELWELSDRLASKPREERFREWFAETARRETPRKMLSDTGIGLIALAAVLGVLRLATGFPLRDSRTPRWRWLFIVVYLLVLAAQVPASIWYFEHRADRFEYPPWGDSIGIGIAGEVVACVVFAVVGGLFWLPFLALSRFPAELYAWPQGQRRFNTIVTIGFGGLAGLSLFSTVGEVRDGNVGGVLLAMVLTYLLLSLRAGLVARQAEKKGTANPAVEATRTGGAADFER
jgi:hypothetical protein